MVSTFPPSNPDGMGIASYELFNVTVNGTTTGSSNVYLHHNSTPEELQLYLSSSLGVQIIVFIAMVSVCSVIVTLGNVPVLLVYCRKTERRTTNTFIKVLAVIDLVVCAVIMPYSMVMELHLITSDILCRVLEFIRHVSIGASNLTLVAIAIERYMAVCVITRRLTVHNVNQGMFVVIAISVFLSVPSMGIFAVVTKEEVRDINCSFPHHFKPMPTFCHFTTSLLGPALSTAYQAALMAFFFITFIAIVILYAIVYGSLWKRAKRRSFKQSVFLEVEPSSSNDRQRSGTGSSSQEREEDTKREKEREKIELQVNEKLIIYPSKQPPQPALLDQASQPPGAERFQSWTDEKEAVCSLAPSRLRQVAKTRANRHRRTARMLFLCSVVFLLTWLPFWVDVFNSTHNLCFRYLFFLGNASNPLVYGISNSHFRQSLVRLMTGLRPQCSGCRRD